MFRVVGKRNQRLLSALKEIALRRACRPLYFLYLGRDAGGKRLGKHLRQVVFILSRKAAHHKNNIFMG